MGKQCASTKTSTIDTTENFKKDSESQLEKENETLMQQVKTLTATFQQLQKTVSILTVAMSTMVENNQQLDILKKEEVRNLIHNDKLIPESTEVDKLD